MYSSNYPYWFLPKNKLWFSDKGSLGGGMAGQLIIVRYNSRSGSIEGYRLLAEHPDQHIVDRWDLDDEVLIHHFTPKVQLFLENPVLTLNRDSYAAGNRMQQEIVIDRDTASHAHCIRSRLFLAQAIAPELQSPSMSLWPPLTLPATNRVRNTSSSLFLDNAHKPSKYSEISDTSFRIRKWMEFRAMRDHQGGNRAGGVLTFSTLPPESYTPTAEKPYQGIWVGDYSAHGCEFLLVLQKSPEEAARTPPIPRQKLAQEHFNSGPTSSSNHAAAPAPSPNDDTADAVGCSGRLEAIKLTGDPNVPRGEYTWIAEDISRKGQLRIAEEQMFAGARVVKSWGHIADQGFANGEILHAITSQHITSPIPYHPDPLISRNPPKPTTLTPPVQSQILISPLN